MCVAGVCARVREGGGVERAAQTVSMARDPRAREAAHHAINVAAVNGSWVLLANAELALPFIATLPDVLGRMAEADSLSPEFRLFIGARPVDALPLPLLHACTGAARFWGMLLSNGARELGECIWRMARVFWWQFVLLPARIGIRKRRMACELGLSFSVWRVTCLVAGTPLAHEAGTGLRGRMMRAYAAAMDQDR